MKKISSWGRLTKEPHETIPLHTDSLVEQITYNSTRPGLAHGLGRSYGDACLNPGGRLWQTTSLDRFISFDVKSGVLRCEAGVSLGSIQTLALPRGWMLPVSPGTQLVTVGGAIANDVHGKNHHRFGTFSHHILKIVLQRTDGETLHCGPNDNPDWFSATCGGLGLTGVIVEAEIQLRPISDEWLTTESLPYNNLDDFFTLSEESAELWEYTVSWFDCTSRQGKGIFMRANHASPEGFREKPQSRRQLTIPFTPPLSLVNGASVKLFNHLYYNSQRRRAGSQQQHYQPFLYPLDNVRNWNRIYGPRGFFQYQSVVPHRYAKDATQAMLKAISSASAGSFLSVLKCFGDIQSKGMLSFPKPGVTLALDFTNQAAKTTSLLNRLDSIVLEAGGRLYPAKDARMPKQLFEEGYPDIPKFLQYHDKGISSAMSKRLLGI